ncbi:sensory neuron membrane protein 2-like [Tribolium madens]|uniref:sensory neuron membrane protein 2-like n=1 Tax=Tribolium madens TaxID=41895 RepID=UPI001CF757A5|nr:sensory neuron membrane protein 2-like [Tribolium madens]
MYVLCPPTVGIFGCFILFLGVISSLYVIPIIENSYFLQAVYKNGSFLFNEFLNPTVKTKIKIYFFDVTNSEEIKNGEKPVLREVGPYVYNELKFRTVINYTENSDTFDFLERTQLFFNAEESGGRTEDDFITVINSALITIGNNIEDQVKHQTDGKINAVFENFLDEYDLFIQARVRDILFDGIVINCLNESGLVCLYLKTEQMEFLREFGNDLKYSIFNHINKTENGPFKILIRNNNSERGHILTYQGRKFLNNWRLKSKCNKIEGSNLIIFPPSTYSTKRSIYTFFSEFCRSIAFPFDGYSKIYDVPVSIYVMDQETFDSSKKNSCFCKSSGKKKGSLSCNIKGTMNLSNCKNMDIILSHPHFYLGDDVLLNYVKGLAPKKKIHDSFIALGIRSGIILNYAIRFQFNVPIKQSKHLGTTNMREGIFPILWTEKVQETDERIITFLKNMFYVINLLHVVKNLILTLGILLMICSLILMVYRDWNIVSGFETTKTKTSRRYSARISKDKTNVNLFPQTINRNVNDGFIKRSQFSVIFPKHVKTLQNNK